MRYILPFVLFVLLAPAVQGQWWFDVGVKGGFGPTLMYDKNVFDHGDYKHKISLGNTFGGRLGFNYGYHIGVALEYNVASSKQEFNFNSNVFNTFTWKHNDLAALFRYSGNGAFIEIGGKYSNLREVELENVQTGISDVTDNFSKNYLSGIFGVGSYLMGNEVLTLNMGLRFHWGLQDMVNDMGKENNYPIVGIGETLDDPTRKTLATAAQLQFELNYAFGSFAKKACHDRWKLILFQ